MLDQSYINIFQNSASKVTIAYAASGSEDSALKLDEVQHIAIEEKDLVVIGNALIDLAQAIHEG